MKSCLICSQNHKREESISALIDLLKGNNIQIQLSVPQLVEKVLNRNEGSLTSTGAVAATTGKYTGRSPKDKYIVKEASTLDTGLVYGFDIQEEAVSTTKKRLSEEKLGDRVQLFHKGHVCTFSGFK